MPSPSLSEDVLPAKVANRAGVLPDKKVTFDGQGDALSKNDVDGERLGGGCYEGGKNVTRVNVPLTEAQKKEKRRLQQKQYRSLVAACCSVLQRVAACCSVL